MRDCEKKRQSSSFDGQKEIPIPIRSHKQRLDNEKPFVSDFTKRTKKHHNKGLFYPTCFDTSMHNPISAKVLNKIQDSKKQNKKTLDTDLSKLKDDLPNKKRVPARVMTDTAHTVGLEANVMRTFMEDNAKKPTYQSLETLH